VTRITLRLIGFGAKAAGLDTQIMTVPEHATVQEVWASLRSSAAGDDLITRIDERQVLAHLNGRLVREHEKREASLREGDTLTFMVQVTGGSSANVWQARRAF